MNAVEDNSVLTKGSARETTTLEMVLRPCAWWAPAVAFVVLSGLTILCYHRSLSGYFLADDLLHVAFLTEVFKGHPELLVQNFHSNWVQAQGTQFYRPMISLTLAFDYLVWGANAFGFHLTNLLLEITSTFLLYLTCCRLFPSMPQSRRRLTAFGAAAIFAVSPLHAEVATWIIARVDSVVTTFYLLTFWLYLKSKQQEQHKRLLLSLSIASFAFALMSKEMAVALPAVLTLCHFLGGVTVSPAPASLGGRVKAAFLNTSPFWILLVAYFGVRTAALGTPLGGYQGSVGSGLTGSLTKRLTDGTFAKLLFPFNAFVFGGGNKATGWLKLLYGLAALSFSVAIVRNLIARKAGLLQLFVFAFGWFVLALLPAIQVLSLADGLQGSRIVYLATAPMALLLSSMIFAPEDEVDKPLPSSRMKRWIGGLRLCLFAAFIVCLAPIAIKNNTPWVHASRELKSLRSAIESELNRLPQDKVIALLNLPQSDRGAHIVYNASTFGVLLRPPLSSVDLSTRVATFEPVTYGYSDLISANRVRTMVESSKKYAWYRWDRNKLSLAPLYLGQSKTQRDSLPLSFDSGEFTLTGDQSLVSPSFNRSPIDCDFLNVELSVTPLDGIDESKPAWLTVYWCTESNPVFSLARCQALPVSADGAKHKYHFNLTEHKVWLASDRVTRLKFDIFPKPSTIKLFNVSLPSSKSSVPELTASTELDGLTQGTPKLLVYYDATAIPGAVKVMYEISKPDSWFEHYSATYRDAAPSKEKLKGGTFDGVKGSQNIDASELGGAGFYEFRVAAVDKDGKMLGYFSDPINFQYSPKGLAPQNQQVVPK